MGNSRIYDISIIAPTCFYYQTPLFQALAADPNINLTVFFCSDEGLSGRDVKAAYGADRSWGLGNELLTGYKSVFLRNQCPGGSYLKSLVGLANFDIWKILRETRPDAVLIMSWMNPTWWLTILACLKYRLPILFMTDSNINAERTKSAWKSWIKRQVLGKFLFPNISGFLCSGSANQQLYKYYGVPDDKLFQFAYSWGFKTLVEQAKDLKSQKTTLRSQYGVPQDAIVALYCGRLSPEKGTLELLEAFKAVPNPKKALVLVGDGRLRNRMRNYVDANSLESVYFMGFQDRNQMGKFYALADFLILPSQKETWGIVINEALSFSLPVIVSDQVGAGVDLVVHRENGYVFPALDVKSLAGHISQMTDLPEQERLRMGENSSKLIAIWIDRDLASSLRSYLDSIHGAHG